MNARAIPRQVGFVHTLAWATALTIFAVLPTDPVAAAPATRTVVIDAVHYEPESITVKRGETVVWINKDPFPHTVTARGAFDSKEIPAGKSWRYTPRNAGQYPYICTLHPTMKGTLNVE